MPEDLLDLCSAAILGGSGADQKSAFRRRTQLPHTTGHHETVRRVINEEISYNQTRGAVKHQRQERANFTRSTAARRRAEIANKEMQRSLVIDLPNGAMGVVRYDTSYSRRLSRALRLVSTCIHNTANTIVGLTQEPS